MMMLYLFLLLSLVLARFLVSRRVARLEKKYARLACAARDLASQPVRQGNGARLDAYAVAKHQYLLGEMTAKRDLAEVRYEAWQARSEKLGKFLARLRSFKGRTVPYLLGVADFALVLVTLTLLGVLEFPALSQALATLFN